MPINSESLNRKLYDLLTVRGYNPKPLDVEGKVTPVPEESAVMKFDFVKDDKNYGQVWISIDGSKTLQVYYGDAVADSPSDKTRDASYDDTWTGLIRHLKNWAQRRQLGFELKNENHLESDMAKRSHTAKKEKISEASTAGKSNSSFIITAKTAEGATKTYRVKAQSPNMAKEKFSQHHSMAKILNVSEEGMAEMDNRTPSGDRKEQRANSSEAIAQREKEQQANLKKVSPEMRKKLRLPDPDKEDMAEDIASTRREVNLKKKIDKGVATPEQKREYQELKAKNMGPHFLKSMGRPVPKQDVAEGLLAQSDEFKVELDDDGMVHVLDGEGTIRVSMPVNIWKRMAGKKGQVDEFSIEVSDGQVHVLDGEGTIRVSMPVNIWKQLGKQDAAHERKRSLQATRDFNRSRSSGMMEQDMAEGQTGVSVKKWAAQVRQEHGADTKFSNDKVHDRVIARKDKEIIGSYDRKANNGTVFSPDSIKEGTDDSTQVLSDIVANEDFDALYNLMSSDTEAGKIVQRMYNDVSGEEGLHPDDDFEKILSIVLDHLTQDYGQQGVAEGSADKTVRVVKRNGKPIGEIGIDPEASPGNGSYYVKLYDGSVDESGFDTAEEALAELKYLVKQNVSEGYSLKKTRVSKHMEPGDPEEYTQDVNIKDTDYEIINNKTGQVVGTASQTTNDFMGSGALKITMKNGATRWLDIWDSEKGNPQTAFNRFVKDPKTASKYKGQDMKGVTEMDKSQTPSGRDGHVSHSTYGSRDKGDSTGPERTAKPVTAKQATTNAMDILNKQLKKKDVAEGYDDDEEFIPQIYARIIPGTKSFLITKVLDANLGLNVGDKVSYIALTRGKFKDIPKSISYNQGVAEAKGDEYYDLTAEHVPAKAIPLIKKELAQAGITLKFVKKRDSFSDETVFEIVTGAKGLKAAKDIIWKYNKGNYVGIMNEQDMTEGSDYTPPELGTVKANLMLSQKPTVQVQVFKHNTLRGDSYWVTKEVRTFKTMDQAQAYVDRINKQDMAEGNLDEEQLKEASARDVLLGLLDKFYADMKLPPRQNSYTGLLNIKSPGTRVWTRGDGVRHRDPGRIEVNYFTDDKKASEKSLAKFWPWLLKQPGVKTIGQVSGEFGRSQMTDAVSYGGLYFTGGPHGVEFGSMSRIKNPKSVWRHAPAQPKGVLPEQDMAEGNPQVNEGYYPMGKQGSYSDAVPTTKIIIQHSRKIEEGEQRYRNIAKIFVENTQGERFAVPTIKPGIARVYARHIAEGGTPYDERGKHITSLVEEYSKMAGFVRATKGKQFNESAQQLVNEGLTHYQSLRESLRKMTGHRGYNAYFESWTPSLMEDGEEQTNLNELFVQETLDPRIESVMPILSRLHKKVSEMAETGQLAEWADSLLDETLNVQEENVPLRDKEDLQARRKAIQDIISDPDTAKDPLLKREVMKRKHDLEKEAEAKRLAEEMVDESANVPMDVRTLYAQTYAKFAKTAGAAKGAKQMAYAMVEKKYGKEIADKLKAYHNSNLDEELGEDLDSNQKRVGQLGPTEKVGPKGAVGKLVGANESVEQGVAEGLNEINSNGQEDLDAILRIIKK